MRKLLILIFLSVPCCLSAQTLPTLLLAEKDARQASLCCPGAAAEAEYGTFRATAGGGIWEASGINSSLLGAEATYRLPFGLEAGIFADFVKDEPYDVTNAKGQVTGSFAPTETAVGISAGYPVLDFLKAGLRMRMISSSLAQYHSASAFGADIFAVYMTKGLRASLEVCNLGSGLDYGAGSYSQPSLARIAAGWNPVKGLLVAADADCLFSGAMMAGAGLEYSLFDIVFLRGGYHYGDAAKAIPSYATVGIGLKIKGITMDSVCFLGTESLSGTAMIRLGYGF